MRVPGLTVRVVGLAPDEEIVTVVPPVEGDEGELPPQAARPARVAAHSIRRTVSLSFIHAARTSPASKPHDRHGLRGPSPASVYGSGGEAPGYCTTMVPRRFWFESSRWSWKPHVPALPNACVTRVCPGASMPSPASRDGQLPCCGCGSEAISCERESLLTTVMACPTASVTVLGLIPADVIVMVATLVPVPPSLTMTVTPPLGDVEEPPQPARSAARENAESNRNRVLDIRKTSVKC